MEFTPQDVEFVECLANCAGSHVERLSLDLMWTKATLERDTGSAKASWIRDHIVSFRDYVLERWYHLYIYIKDIYILCI